MKKKKSVLVKLVKARIKRHNKPDKTGMIHLCDSAWGPDEETGHEVRKRLFPVDSIVMAKPAHWYGEIQVFHAFGPNNEFDYFDHNEIEILEKDELFEYYPDAGYGGDRKYFDEYMDKFNEQ